MSPLISTLGAGSNKGFGFGAGGASYPDNFADAQALGFFNTTVAFGAADFGTGYSSGWGYNTSVADMIKVTLNVDGLIYGWVSGALTTGSMTSTCRIFDSSNTLVFEETGMVVSSGVHHRFQFSGGVSLLTAGTYQLEQVPTSVSSASGYFANARVTGPVSVNGLSLTQSDGSGPISSGRSSNGTSTSSGQIYMIYAVAASQF